ncbi:unnamed protein product [Amoebophrya sp. A120]|nr:unnamed protein product [Amoebophrya sp. A120]|eukprot:GSA120T00000295001.1
MQSFITGHSLQAEQITTQQQRATQQRSAATTSKVGVGGAAELPDRIRAPATVSGGSFLQPVENFINGTTSSSSGGAFGHDTAAASVFSSTTGAAKIMSTGSNKISMSGGGGTAFSSSGKTMNVGAPSATSMSGGASSMSRQGSSSRAPGSTSSSSSTGASNSFAHSLNPSASAKNLNSAGKQVMSEATDLIKGFFGSVQKKVYEVFNEDENEFAEFAGLGIHGGFGGMHVPTNPHRGAAHRTAGEAGTTGHPTAASKMLHTRPQQNVMRMVPGEVGGNSGNIGTTGASSTAQATTGSSSAAASAANNPASCTAGGGPVSGGVAGAATAGGTMGSNTGAARQLPSAGGASTASSTSQSGGTAAVPGTGVNLRRPQQKAGSSSSSRGDPRRATMASSTPTAAGTGAAAPAHGMVMDKSLSIWKDALQSVGSNVRDLHASERVTYDLHRCLIFGTEIEFTCEGQLVKSVKVGSRVWSSGQQQWVDAVDAEIQRKGSLPVQECLDLLLATQKDYLGADAAGEAGKGKIPQNLEEATAITNQRPIFRRNRRAWDWPLSRDCYRMRFVEVLKSECAALGSEREQLAAKLDSIHGALGQH